MNDLFHYTCDHGRQGLGASGVALPGADLIDGAVPWTAALVWLTDLTRPVRDALGLTSHLIRCDRTQHRYRVTDLRGVEPWTVFARSLPSAYREALELAPGARPRHWYVCPTGVPVAYDPVSAGVRA